MRDLLALHERIELQKSIVQLQVQNYTRAQGRERFLLLLGRELEHLVGVPCALTARVCVSVYLSERVADDGPQLQLPW